MIKGKIKGEEFEKILEKMAQLSGLFVKRNKLTAFYTSGGVQLIKSELDFTVITEHGRVAFIDAKSFQGDRFSYSALNPHQIQRALNYNRLNVPSGFACWLRGTGQIVFLSGLVVQNKGHGTSFSIEDGLPLGPLMRFDLRKIFSA